MADNNSAVPREVTYRTALLVAVREFEEVTAQVRPLKERQSHLLATMRGLSGLLGEALPESAQEFCNEIAERSMRQHGRKR